MGIKYNGRQVLDIYVGEEPVQAIFMNGVQVFDTTDRGNIEDWVYNRVGDNIHYRTMTFICHHSIFYIQLSLAATISTIRL